MHGSPSKVRQILQRIVDALSETATEVRTYIREHPKFKQVGEDILAAWQKGQDQSLRSP